MSDSFVSELFVRFVCLVARKLSECLVQFFANRFAFLLLLVQYVCKENQLCCTMMCHYHGNL